MCFACMWICLNTTFMPSAHKGHGILWTWSYRLSMSGKAVVLLTTKLFFSSVSTVS